HKVAVAVGHGAGSKPLRPLKSPGLEALNPGPSVSGGDNDEWPMHAPVPHVIVLCSTDRRKVTAPVGDAVKKTFTIRGGPGRVCVPSDPVSRGLNDGIPKITPPALYSNKLALAVT